MSDDPKQKYFGKYNSLEDAEEGFRNLVSQLDQLKAESREARELNAQLLQTFQGMQQPRQPEPTKPAPQLYDEEGNLDARALLEAIDDRLTTVEHRIPSAAQEAVQQMLNPVISATSARDEFFSRDDLEEKFTPMEFDRALSRNPGLKKAYSKLLADPESASVAYETIYQLWKANQQKATPKSDERTKEKKAAGDLAPQGGRPEPVGPEAQHDMEELRNRAMRAQDMMSTDEQLAFARDWIKGSKLSKNLEDVPDWADDAWRQER
jgi:hypothetical protein